MSRAPRGGSDTPPSALDRPRWDPLAAARQQDPGAMDVFTSGTVFLDIIFTGLPSAPSAGTEVWASGMGSAPGGIANLAVAAARLGLRTGLAAGFGDDAYGDFCWRTLGQEGVDLARSRRFTHWHTPVTVSMAVDRDRSMVTHGHDLPIAVDELISKPPHSRAVVASLGDASGDVELPGWARQASSDGAMVFADVGWDPSGIWNPALANELGACHAFIPNAVEAMSYTHADTPEAALRTIADWVPLAVVTLGSEGSMAIDSSTGEEARVPPLPTVALDPTGAGDVFGAGLVLGTVAGWPLRERLLFAGLCAGLAVQHFGGSLAAPGWGDLTDWWRATTERATVGDPAARELATRYGFLPDLLPTDLLPAGPVSEVRRAHATLARYSDLDAA
ncbi:Sugar or nucleoside kinase, ribokinase family [Micromonospora rhizosphaerae]|uniref:Sugar or nucleoside kinase, ribokinase family n=2 Tax=Micromonospora rhizosphaerae TaxID=568872 RepID=A0A1C6SZ55_9ACTN|nr:Sugar or nucleoside kinase, ribokinase family [Micromonospora rhizosphaerae]